MSREEELVRIVSDSEKGRPARALSREEEGVRIFSDSEKGRPA
jgi:hypothetical protein